MDELFIDGTVKCCSRYFCQLYTIHGLKNANYVPLVFCLLASKKEMCYTAMWSLIIDYCKSKNLDLLLTALHLDFEKAMHNVINKLFPSTKIRCCTFHLGQCWWRKIQSIGLSKEYKEKNDHVGKWLIKLFGLPFLPPNEVEDCFVEELMDDAPENEAGIKFADYVLEHFVLPTCNYPPSTWAATPDTVGKRNRICPFTDQARLYCQYGIQILCEDRLMNIDMVLSWHFCAFNFFCI